MIIFLSANGNSENCLNIYSWWTCGGGKQLEQHSVTFFEYESSST